MADTQTVGKIVQCIGAVVDVEFPRDQMPKVYDALKMDGSALTLEVQQQLGDGIVRTIALGSSDGLRRGMQVTNTHAQITVPVARPPWVASWTCSARPSTNVVRSTRLKPPPSTARPLRTTSCRRRKSCWKPASR